jgi:hypothetical protein
VPELPAAVRLAQEMGARLAWREVLFRKVPKKPELKIAASSRVPKWRKLQGKTTQLLGTANLRDIFFLKKEHLIACARSVKVVFVNELDSDRQGSDLHLSDRAGIMNIKPR